MEASLATKLSNVSGAQPCDAERVALHRRYARKLAINRDLTRALVSFQANRQVAFYRWLKYKEAFSSELVRYFLDRFQPRTGSTKRILDPFAGVGTTLTTASEAGWDATGIELLPVGTAAIRARLLADKIRLATFEHYLERIRRFPLESPSSNGFRFPHLPITEKAFPEPTERGLSAYAAFLETIEDRDVWLLFWFGCLSILEEVSYTRKDGQYLRWDSRSGRSRSKFNKGIIYDLKAAILRKLEVMHEDIKIRKGRICCRNVRLIEGSCLTELPRLPDASFDLILTSPPYCNRYDYTRTYALELAFLGYDDRAVKELRQSLLSCTVENKTKRDYLAHLYRLRSQQGLYRAATDAFANQRALQEVLRLLCEARAKGELNNGNIPNLVENYFFEMNLVIRELSRILVPGGHVVMVNDNVQYSGQEIPVDLILSDFAASAGLQVDHVWVLPRGKGTAASKWELMAGTKFASASMFGQNRKPDACEG